MHSWHIIQCHISIKTPKVEFVTTLHVATCRLIVHTHVANVVSRNPPAWIICAILAYINDLQQVHACNLQAIADFCGY